MIAKLENIGPFHLFFTLSCGDTRYDENFSSFLVENNYELEYLVRADGTTETNIKEANGTYKNLKQFLEEDVNESLHELIRANVLTATRNFHHRVDAFRNEIIMGKNNPMKVKHISYRVEFQGRGAAHIHGTLWLNMKELEKSSPLRNEKGHISEAFKKLREDVKLSEEEKEAVATFTDMFITCSLNPDTVHEEKDLGLQIVQIASTVNCHHCTNPCKNYSEKCKYGFPRFPLKKNTCY